MGDIIEAVAKAFNQFGPVAALLAGLAGMNAFFIWRDYRREASQGKQIAELQQAYTNTVLPLLTECKEAIASCKEVIYQNSQIITSWLNNGRR